MSARPPPIGALTDRVELRVKAMAPDAGGGHALAYVPLATVWARVRLLSARMALSADARSAMISHAVVLRYRRDIGPGDRIVHRGRALEVVSAGDLDGRRAYLSCACAETEATG